jgi:hypothetical protein
MLSTPFSTWRRQVKEPEKCFMWMVVLMRGGGRRLTVRFIPVDEAVTAINCRIRMTLAEKVSKY